MLCRDSYLDTTFAGFLSRVNGGEWILQGGRCEKGFSHQRMKGFSHQRLKGFLRQRRRTSGARDSCTGGYAYQGSMPMGASGRAASIRAELYHQSSGLVTNPLRTGFSWR